MKLITKRRGVKGYENKSEDGLKKHLVNQKQK